MMAAPDQNDGPIIQINMAWLEYLPRFSLRRFFYGGDGEGLIDDEAPAGQAVAQPQDPNLAPRPPLNDAAADPLVDIVHQFPNQAVWFIKIAMIFGSVTGVLVSVPCTAFLLLYWSRCSECNRPLHYWILIHTCLLVFQTPVRVVFCYSIMAEERAGSDPGRLEQLVRRLTSARAWKMSKLISIATYLWFVLGLVWVLNSSHCPQCPGLYRLVIAVILTAIIRLLVTLVCFYQCFPIRPRLMNLGFLQRPQRPVGITDEQLEMLGQWKYTTSSSASGSTAEAATSSTSSGSDNSSTESDRTKGCVNKPNSATTDQELQVTETTGEKVQRTPKTPTAAVNGRADEDSGVGRSAVDEQRQGSNGQKEQEHAAEVQNIEPAGATKSSSTTTSTSTDLVQLAGAGAVEPAGTTSTTTKTTTAPSSPDDITSSKATGAAVAEKSSQVDNTASERRAESTSNTETGKQDESSGKSSTAGSNTPPQLNHDTCAVCLSEFADGDIVRTLPCAHIFHQPCIDKWLKKNRKCPLCLQDVLVLLERRKKND
ncbi:unnamed protein product [Amoebophrya sp. A120]|nr:unnamed protein product [Amoebophrya sp. A120]|eukprot:GSA120T00025387001.1